MHNKVMGQTRSGFTEDYAQSLRVDCDLELWSSDTAFLRHIVLSNDAKLFITMHDNIMGPTRTGFTEA